MFDHSDPNFRTGRYDTGYTPGISAYTQGEVATGIIVGEQQSLDQTEFEQRSEGSNTLVFAAFILCALIVIFFLPIFF